MAAQTTNVAAWILGSGGLLGGGLVRQATRFGVDVFSAPSIPWQDAHTRQQELRGAAQAFRDYARGRPMAVIWAAGTTGVGSQDAQTQMENQALRDLVAAMNSHWSTSNDFFFLASSAGAVYADAGPAPFEAQSPTAAGSPYGQAKLWQEDFVGHELPPTVSALIGRLGNIYGYTARGRQGLISRLCSAALSRLAMNLFVPLDTLRDYCFVEDAAYLVWSELLSLETPRHTSVIGSGRAVSISEVISTVQLVTHRKVPIALGSDPEAQLQPVDLRLIPNWLTADPTFRPLDLGTGIKRLVDDLVIAPRT